MATARSAPTSLITTTVDESFDFLFKIVLIGDCGTGKTCIVQRFKSGNFIESHGNTIGVDFSMKAVTVDDKKVKVSSVPRGRPASSGFTQRTVDTDQRRHTRWRRCLQGKRPLVTAF